MSSPGCSFAFSPRKSTAASFGLFFTRAAFLCLSSSRVYTLFAASACGQNTLSGWSFSSVKFLPGVPVEDRPAERHPGLGVAVRPDGLVPAGHHELELVRPRLPEEGDALGGAERLAAGVVLQLLHEPLVPVRVHQPLEDVAHDAPLLLREELAVQGVLGDLPVVRSRTCGAARGPCPCGPRRSTRPSSGLVGEGVVQRFHGGLGGGLHRRAGGGLFGGGEQRQAGRRRGWRRWPMRRN